MIVDVLENSDRYKTLHPLFEKAFEFLKTVNADARTARTFYAPGRHEIDDDKIYASISKGLGRSKGDAQLEAHRKYIDIQYIIAGSDQMGWKAREDCVEEAVPYDAEKDVEFFADKPDTWITCRPGMYAIFFPEDAHLPLISDGEVHKVVVKVAVD